MIVQEKGPTCFVLSDEAKQKYEVKIGEHQLCSCRSKELCVHIVCKFLYPESHFDTAFCYVTTLSHPGREPNYMATKFNR